MLNVRVMLDSVGDNVMNVVIPLPPLGDSVNHNANNTVSKSCSTTHARSGRFQQHHT